MITETEICTLNLTTEVASSLKANGIKFFDGSIGNLTRLHYSKGYVECLLNYKYPKNFQEYQVLIIDLNNDKEIFYDYQQHQHKNSKSPEKHYLICSHPQDIFDPRPLSLKLMDEIISSNLDKGFLMVVFCSEDEKVMYNKTGNSYDNFEVNNYEFTYGVPYRTNKHGLKTIIPNEQGELYSFLKKFNSSFSYHVLFDHPDRTVNGQYGPDPDFKPLVLTADGNIAGISWSNEKSGMFFFPETSKKAEFLEEFLKEIAPTYFPHLFPGIVKDKWLEQPEYQLTSTLKLQNEKEKLVEEFNHKLSEKDKEIQLDEHKYGFLKRMLIDTDQPLVDSVIAFLKWLGFNKVIDADKIPGRTIKEEDIQIETDQGLIIIEVKGLGGKTKDSECSQVSKFRNRRQKERDKLDVHAHFLVNHERHKPAMKRANPPFTEFQMSDAEFDSRGLMTTWQLFQVYRAITNGIFSKAQIRSCFFCNGYINFIPQEMVELGKPQEVFAKNSVIVITLDERITLKVNDRLVYKVADSFQAVNIKSIQYDNKPVQKTGTGSFGLKLSHSIPNDTRFFVYPTTMPS